MRNPTSPRPLPALAFLFSRRFARAALRPEEFMSIPELAINPLVERIIKIFDSGCAIRGLASLSVPFWMVCGGWCWRSPNLCEFSYTSTTPETLRILTQASTFGSLSGPWPCFYQSSGTTLPIERLSRSRKSNIAER